MWGTKDHRYNPGYYPGSHPLPLGSLRRVLSFTHIYRLCRDNTQQIQFFHILKPSLQLKYSLLMSTPHLQFILDKTELLFLPRKASPIHKLSIHTEGQQGVGPGSCHLASRLRQLPSGWFACMLHSSSSAPPECSSPAGLQPTPVHPHSTTPPHHALATSGFSTTIHPRYSPRLE